MTSELDDSSGPREDSPRDGSIVREDLRSGSSLTPRGSVHPRLQDQCQSAPRSPRSPRTIDATCLVVVHWAIVERYKPGGIDPPSCFSGNDSPARGEYSPISGEVRKRDPPERQPPPGRRHFRGVVDRSVRPFGSDRERFGREFRSNRGDPIERPIIEQHTEDRPDPEPIGGFRGVRLPRRPAEGEDFGIGQQETPGVGLDFRGPDPTRSIDHFPTASPAPRSRSRRRDFPTKGRRSVIPRSSPSSRPILLANRQARWLLAAIGAPAGFPIGGRPSHRPSRRAGRCRPANRSASIPMATNRRPRRTLGGRTSRTARRKESIGSGDHPSRAGSSEEFPAGRSPASC